MQLRLFSSTRAGCPCPAHGSLLFSFRSLSCKKFYPTPIIVWFKDCFETAEEAALVLNGQTVFPLQHPQETVQSAVGRFLEQRVGYAKSLIHMVEPVAEYVRRENVFENTPCRSSNCYTAAVVIPPAAKAA